MPYEIYMSLDLVCDVCGTVEATSTEGDFADWATELERFISYCGWIDKDDRLFCCEACQLEYEGYSE